MFWIENIESELFRFEFLTDSSLVLFLYFLFIILYNYKRLWSFYSDNHVNCVVSNLFSSLFRKGHQLLLFYIDCKRENMVIIWCTNMGELMALYMLPIYIFSFALPPVAFIGIFRHSICQLFSELPDDRKQLEWLSI